MIPPKFITAPEQAAVERFIEWTKARIGEQWICYSCSDVADTEHDVCLAGQIALEMINILKKEMVKGDRA